MSSSAVSAAASGAAAALLRPRVEGDDKAGALKGRASMSWAEGTAIAVTIVCVMGLVLSIIAGYPTHAFFFGVGTVFSAYTIYLARHSSVLKFEGTRIQKSNTQLEKYLETLKQRLKELWNTAEAHKKANEQHEKHLETLEQQLQELLNTAEAHKTENEKQAAITEIFSGLEIRSREQFEAFVKSLTERLRKLAQGTGQVEQLAQVLATTIEKLSTIVNAEELARLQGRQEGLVKAQEAHVTSLEELRARYASTFDQTLHSLKHALIKALPDQQAKVEAAFNATRLLPQPGQSPAPVKAIA